MNPLGRTQEDRELLAEAKRSASKARRWLRRKNKNSSAKVVLDRRGGVYVHLRQGRWRWKWRLGTLTAKRKAR